MKKQIEAGEKPDLNIYFAGKNAIADFVSDMDLVITLCDVPNGRPSFGMSKGGGEIPWYVFEVPVVVVGCGQPTMLADIPQARTYINTYDSKDTTLDALVENLMNGEEAFKGTDPIDSFCGLFDAKTIRRKKKRFTQDVDLFFLYMWEKSAVKIRKIKWGRDFNKN